MHEKRRLLIGKTAGRLFGCTTAVDKTIGTLGPLQDDIRALLFMCRHKCSVQCPTLFVEDSCNDLDAGISQQSDTPTGDLGKRVETPYDNTGYLLLDNQEAARRGLPVMGAGFERDIQRGAGKQFGISHRSNGIDFGMRAAELPVIPLAYYPAIAHDDGSHHGVGRHMTTATGCQLQASPHIHLVNVLIFHCFYLIIILFLNHGRLLSDFSTPPSRRLRESRRDSGGTANGFRRHFFFYLDTPALPSFQKIGGASA